MRMRQGAYHDQVLGLGPALARPSKPWRTHSAPRLREQPSYKRVNKNLPFLRPKLNGRFEQGPWHAKLRKLSIFHQGDIETTATDRSPNGEKLHGGNHNWERQRTGGTYYVLVTCVTACFVKVSSCRLTRSQHLFQRTVWCVTFDVGRTKKEKKQYFSIAQQQQ